MALIGLSSKYLRLGFDQLHANLSF